MIKGLWLNSRPLDCVKSQTGLDFVIKKAWISTKQNLKYLQIFESSISTLIPNKKHIKSDIQKT